MNAKPLICARWALATLVAGALFAPLAPSVWADAPASIPDPDTTLRHSDPESSDALRQFSVGSQNLYKKVSASLFRVKLDVSPENAMPQKLRKEFEDWKEKFLKDRPAATGPAEAVSVTIEPRDTPGPRRPRFANATQPFGGPGFMANSPLMRRFLEQRLQKSEDLESSMNLRQALQHLEALRNAQSNEAIGIVLDNDGYALVLSPLVQTESGKTTVAITALDGTEGQATLIGTDLGRGYTILKLEKHPAAAPGFADAKPAAGELVMCLSASHGSVGWITMPAPTLVAGAAGHKGEDGFAVFGIEDHTPVYLFNLNGQLAAIGTDRHAATVDDLKNEWKHIKTSGPTPRRPLGVKYDVVSADSPYRVQYKNLGERPALRVTKVFPGTPAEHAGIRQGDFLLTIDGQPITALPEIMHALHANKGGSVHLVLLRDDQEVPVDLASDKGDKAEKGDK